MKSIFRADLFAQKTVLITGGGSGIGFRIANELADLGARVALASRNRERIDGAVAKLREQGYDAFGVTCNVRDAESVQNCVATCVQHFGGKLDALVNNAGGQFPAPATEITAKGWKAVLETNLDGTFAMSVAAFQQAFRKQQSGAIVNVIANMWNGFPYMSHTGAARAGVDNLTKSLALEWGAAGVRVNAVAPGTIDSDGLGTYPDAVQKRIRAYGSHNQSGRLGTVGEVAAAVIFLLSPGAQFISGATLRVDAGESLYSPLLSSRSDAPWPVLPD